MEEYKHPLFKSQKEEDEFFKSLHFDKLLDQRRDLIDCIDKEYGLDFLKDTAMIILNRIRYRTTEEEFEKIINKLKNNSNIMAEKHRGKLKND